MADLPSVTIILPVFNEIDFIDTCLGSLTSQDYEGSMSIVVADGGSTDGTIDALARWSADSPLPIKVIANPDRVQSLGLNRAAAVADGDVLVRMDAHTWYAGDYVSRSIAALRDTGGAAAGGPMVPIGDTPFGRAIAAAMASPVTMGPARFHHTDVRTEADTVYLGAFWRDQFLALGGYRAFPSKVAEDADLYHRWRQDGGTIIVDPAIESTYTPRRTSRALWTQYWRYGQGKAELLFANGKWPSWRPGAPLALVVGTAAALAAGVIQGLWWPLAALLGLWAAVIGTVAVRAGEGAFRVFGAAAIMHWSYGLGLAWGLLRGPWPVRKALRRHR